MDWSSCYTPCAPKIAVLVELPSPDAALTLLLPAGLCPPGGRGSLPSSRHRFPPSPNPGARPGRSFS